MGQPKRFMFNQTFFWTKWAEFKYLIRSVFFLLVLYKKFSLSHAHEVVADNNGSSNSKQNLTNERTFFAKLLLQKIFYRENSHPHTPTTSQFARLFSIRNLYFTDDESLHLSSRC